MNYYEHHLGDYMRDTAHLSVIEDGIYRRLLDAYYIREKPLPLDVRDCRKLARAVSKAEREAVSYVLGEFFVSADDGYRHKRCDAEIARAIEKRKQASRNAKARWEHMRTPCETDAPAMRPQCKGNALQSPVSNKKEEEEVANAPPPPPRKRRKPDKTPLPDDFGLDPDLERYAHDRLPSVDLPALMESFRGKAQAKGWTYASWRAAFQEFVRNCAPSSGHWAAGQYPKAGSAQSGKWL